MRNYSKETDWDAKKYKRLTFKVDRQQYEKLPPERQKKLGEAIRRVIKAFLKGGGE